MIFCFDFFVLLLKAWTKFISISVHELVEGSSIKPFWSNNIKRFEKNKLFLIFFEGPCSIVRQEEVVVLLGFLD